MKSELYLKLKQCVQTIHSIQHTHIDDNNLARDLLLLQAVLLKLYILNLCTLRQFVDIKHNV